MTRQITPAGSERDGVSIDMSIAHTSRIYDYLLGGSNNFAVDRQVAEHAFDAYPGGLEGARTDARANRAFLGRAVRHLAAEAGIRQFLDIGTGIPNADNTHALAQQIAPDSRIVYVDNDPIVLAHAHELLKGTHDGATAYLDGDLRRPEGLLAQAAATLDFDEPVALVTVGVLHVIPDEDGPYECIATLVEALAPGSYLVLSHLTNEADLDASADDGGDMSTVHARLQETMHATNPPALRTRAEVTRFFDGLEVIEPGVVEPAAWRPDAPPTAVAGARVVPLYCGVGRRA